MTITVAQVANDQTFGTWLAVTNRSAQVLSENTVTCDASANGSLSTGNSFVNGAFGAIRLVANTIGGGNVQTANTLYFTTNVTFQATINLGATTLFSANGATGTDGQVLQSNGTSMYWVSGPATAYTNAAARAADAYSNAVTFAANATNLSTGTLNTARLPATANISTALNVGANVTANTTAFLVGANVVANSTTLRVGNSTVNTQLTSTGILVNSSGSNVNLTTSGLYFGNSTFFTTANSTYFHQEENKFGDVDSIIKLANGTIYVQRDTGTLQENNVLLHLHGYQGGIFYQDMSSNSTVGTATGILQVLDSDRLRWSSVPPGPVTGNNTTKFADLIFANSADGTTFAQLVLGGNTSVARSGQLTLCRSNSIDEGGQMSFGGAYDGAIAWVVDVYGGNTVTGNATPYMRWSADGTDEKMRLEHTTGNLLLEGTVGSLSDARTKENVTTLTNSLTKINQLRGVKYKRKSRPQDGDKFGVVAQELQEVFPELCLTMSGDSRKKPPRTVNDKIVSDAVAYEDQLAVDYTGLISVLIEAVKELSAKVETLERRAR